MGGGVGAVESDFFDDEKKSDLVFALLDQAWPTLTERTREAARLGFHWKRISRPFAIFERGRVLAHAGVLQLEAVIAGAPRTFGGIHAVSTNPRRRRQGLCRRVMEAALAWCDERYETVILFSKLTDLYAKFGFRSVPQHRFARRVDGSTSAGKGGSGTDTGDLTPFQADDTGMAQLRGYLARRQPVSQVYGPTAGAELFGLNEILMRRSIDRLWHCPELAFAAACDCAGGILRLYDLISEAPPSLEPLLERIPAPVTRVELYFTPDRLAQGFRAESCSPESDGLMVRGPLASEDVPFLIPPHARC